MAKILVAEDELHIRELIGFTLTFGGHEVTTVANGAEAVEVAPTLLPDLIMLDVRMPRMTGYEACHLIRQNPTLEKTPVIILTAMGQDEEIDRGLEAGATAYILKPFDPMDLVRRVGDILGKAGIT